MENILIVTVKEWNIHNYFRLKEVYGSKFSFHLIREKEELNIEYIRGLNPKYIFFPHWSYLIEEEIYTSYTCIVFHMTDLPYGRGGSPLQNLIIREVYNTKISALRVEKKVDAGDIFLKEDFDISSGSAEEIFIKTSDIIFYKMIPKILSEEISPKKQIGDITVFKRRKPFQSNLLEIDKYSISKIYDFIRMLDGEGYPKAFIQLDNIKIEFSEVHLKNKKIVGRFEVRNNG